MPISPEQKTKQKREGKYRRKTVPDAYRSAESVVGNRRHKRMIVEFISISERQRERERERDRKTETVFHRRSLCRQIMGAAMTMDI